MKIYIVLFQLVLFIRQVIFGDDFLSRFHQHGYKIKDDRIELVGFDKYYFNFFEIKAFKYNRTTTAHNLSVNFKVDVGDRIMLLVQGFKFLSNEYREISLRFQMNAAKTFHSNIAGSGNMLKCGNLKNGFNFSKDLTYDICNFIIDENQLPPLIPNGRYKCNVQFEYLENIIATLYVFVEVYTPMKYQSTKING